MILKPQMVVACLVGLIVAGSIQTLVQTPVLAKNVSEAVITYDVYKKANSAVVTVRVGAKSFGSGFILKVPHSYTVAPQAVRVVKLGDSCTAQNRTRIGAFKAPLDTPLRQMPKVVLTFLMIFAAPWQSQLRY